MKKFFLLGDTFTWGPLKKKGTKRKNNLKEENNYFGWKKRPHHTSKDIRITSIDVITSIMKTVNMMKYEYECLVR